MKGYSGHMRFLDLYELGVGGAYIGCSLFNTHNIAHSQRCPLKTKEHTLRGKKT